MNRPTEDQLYKAFEKDNVLSYDLLFIEGQEIKGMDISRVESEGIIFDIEPMQYTISCQKKLPIPLTRLQINGE